MDNADIPHLEVRERRLRQFLHLVEGHGFISFVVKIECAPSAGMVADNPFKNRGRSILGMLDGIGNLLDRNLLAHNRTVLRLKVDVRRLRSNRRLSSTYRGQQADLVALTKNGRSRGVLLVDGAGNGARQRLKARK